MRLREIIRLRVFLGILFYGRNKLSFNKENNVYYFQTEHIQFASKQRHLFFANELEFNHFRVNIWRANQAVQILVNSKYVWVQERPLKHF